MCWARREFPTKHMKRMWWLLPEIHLNDEWKTCAVHCNINWWASDHVSNQQGLLRSTCMRQNPSTLPLKWQQPFSCCCFQPDELLWNIKKKLSDFTNRKVIVIPSFSLRTWPLLSSLIDSPKALTECQFSGVGSCLEKLQLIKDNVDLVRKSAVSLCFHDHF